MTKSKYLYKMRSRDFGSQTLKKSCIFKKHNHAKIHRSLGKEIT
jgi:hypothetical protein